MTGRTRRPRPPAQVGLWGRREPLPAARKAPGRAATNDLDLFASVVTSAQDPGYVLIGPAERVMLRDPTCGKTHVTTVPRYEADTVAQLLDAGHLKIGGTHVVTDGRREGPARSVLVPTATKAMVARWAALRPLTATPDLHAGHGLALVSSADEDGSAPSEAGAGARGRRGALWCPECGEPAQPRPPSRWPAANGSRPDHSHLDGEPLCPVVTATGYRPAWPTTRRPQ